ncbi:hypothetical protein, variant 1 [Aphanomyces invadans]|uniref:Inward rectifier potassium channel C-terminal domain-containing protein n=1 Tax=Aphanomyces invadans TaxID=157072 RepID=A0A024TD48_9STRA|nr:hypothetical protein, variant 1 [Aphanomyces invadans]ETV91904.1 hypothetical protein, variant 1 [Aphanomyces invadans]|eukprot:XP_008879541.1 hypothetical protein, variant 1 [Aphanomyces invadans]
MHSSTRHSMETSLLQGNAVTDYASTHHRGLMARLVDRAGSYDPLDDPDPTTRGVYNITRIGGNWRQIYWDDIFHTVIHTNTIRLLSGICITYTAVVFVFAMFYYSVSQHDERCNVGISTVMEAYIFSVETIMTIGYGAPTNDIFYGGCSSMALLLTVESIAGVFLNSICVGVFFVRFARATKRATSVVFSKHAVVRKIDGDFFVMFQVCERRRHQLVEAHVRCYGVAKRHCHVPFHVVQMRVHSPDDNLGASLLMALPQVVAHRIDLSSPLYPPSATQLSHPTQYEIAHHIAHTDLELVVVLEGTDATTGNTMQVRPMTWHAVVAEALTNE